MELKRYGHVWKGHFDGGYKFEESEKGEYVKYADIKSFLKQEGRETCFKCSDKNPWCGNCKEDDCTVDEKHCQMIRVYLDAKDGEERSCEQCHSFITGRCKIDPLKVTVCVLKNFELYQPQPKEK